MSSNIEHGGSHSQLLAHQDTLNTIIYNLDKALGGVAIIGETGTGKTSLVYALAEQLLEGKDKTLQYYQVISLNAAAILSAAQGNLENLLLRLFGEAVQAGNIILFLDEAQLFFGSGTGAFDVSQILQPVLQSSRVKIIAAFTPNDFQHLKTVNQTMASNFVTVAIPEPEGPVVMDILEDSAVMIQGRNGLLVSYQAVREAYRLSGHYMQEESYPGKAISLLEQASAYAENGVITGTSVASAIEKAKGVRVATATAEEKDVLLNLEERIHSRMINQKRAVNVVSAALRRTRAGVSSGKRPAGSFLFLGPTGVGKTELAKSLAATYFGSETQMIRLDMSEYQQPADVQRLLDNGAQGSQGLLLEIRKQPFAVVLLDEIEKAHPNILNLMLQMLDEGKLTDIGGRPASFTDAIIIATSNAGSLDIIQHVTAGEQLEALERPLIEKLISSGQFKPELINRFDEVVLFRPLNKEELTQVATLMISDVNKTLAKQSIKVELTPEALARIVEIGYDPEFGARPMRRTVQKMVQDAVAVRILRGDVQAGQTISLDVSDLAGQD